MKKIISLFALLFCAFILSSCTNNSLHSQQKNLTNYYLDIEFFDEEMQRVAVKQKVDYINNTDQVFEQISFHLYATAFREGASVNVVSLASHSAAYYSGTSYGNFEIKAVTNAKQAPIEFEIAGQDDNILTVKLESKLYPKERVVLNFEFEVILPNINHRFGRGQSTTNLANFFPIACVYENGAFMTKPYSPNGDPFYSDMANFTASVTYPENFVLASTGVQLSTQKENYKKTTKINAPVVRDFALVLSEKFLVVEEMFENTKVIYYYFEEETPEKSLKTAVLSLKTFSEYFGKYPYETLSVVKASFVHGGMEYPNLVYISESIKNYQYYQNVIIHEIAHQWWYNMVGSNAYDNAWLDEGLTDYSTALFYEVNPQYEIRLEDLMLTAMTTYSYYVETFTAVYKTVDTSMNRSLNEYKSESEYVYIAYVKGMLLFDSLRNLLGDQEFFKALKLYFNTFQFKNATPYDLIATFEKSSNKNLEAFFDSWISGKLVVLPNSRLAVGWLIND